MSHAGTPQAGSTCTFAGGAVFLYVGYTALGAPPHEGGTSVALPALGSAGNLTTYGYSSTTRAYLTFMTGPLNRPLYGTVYTSGDPTYRVSLAKLQALGGVLYALASDGFTGVDLARYSPPAPAYNVVVVNARQPQLLVMDPVDMKLRIVDLPLGKSASPPDGVAHQLAPSPDSPYVYVTASTSSGMGELLVVNLTTGTLFGPPIELGLNTDPQGVVITQGAQFAYVAEQAKPAVAVVNLADRQFTDVGLGSSPAIQAQGVALGAGGQQVYVADGGLNRISVIQTSNDLVSGITLPAGVTPFAVAPSPDGSQLWVADSNGGTAGQVTEVDLSTDALREFQVGPLTPTGIAVSPDGAQVFVSHQWDSIAVINAKTGSVAEHGSAGPVVAGVAVSPGGGFVYLAAAGIQFGTGLVVLNTANDTDWGVSFDDYPAGVYVVPVVATGLTVSSLASSLNTPWKAFRSPQLAAANLAITIPLVLLVTFPSSIFNHTFQDNYEEIRELTERRLRWLRRLRDRFERKADRRAAGWLFAGTLLVGALLDALLSPNFGLNGTSIVSYIATALALCLSVAIVPLVSYLYRRRRGRDASWQPQAIPLGLAVAGACVLVSRLTGFQPGYFYGLVCGVVFATQLRRNEQGHVAALAALTYLAVGVLAWFIWAAIHGPAQFPGAAPPLILLDDLLASVFVGALVGNVLALLPLEFTQGGMVAAWHKGAWAAVFGVALFGVIHVFLHPEPGAVHVGSAPLVTAIVLFVVFGAASLGLHRYFRWEQRPTKALLSGASRDPAPPPPGSSDVAGEGPAGAIPPAPSPK